MASEPATDPPRPRLLHEPRVEVRVNLHGDKLQVAALSDSVYQPCEPHP
jgi:hypothetical protein